MPLSLSEDTAQLVGVVSVDEAEPLAQWLRDTASPKVGLKRCSTLHTAALQALLAARPEVVSPPRDPFLVTWVLPLLGTDDEDVEEGDEDLVDEGSPADEVPPVDEVPPFHEVLRAEAAGGFDPANEVDPADELDGLELDDSLVIPAGLAALGEPDELPA